mmetsp:Transcript_34180/g.109755  ORF Transcript_34180/g.109755 Transcript_34180/m.109755 type:complete len:180 (-) Transcript_34180:343-882(-)
MKERQMVTTTSLFGVVALLCAEAFVVPQQEARGPVRLRAEDDRSEDIVNAEWLTFAREQQRNETTALPKQPRRPVEMVGGREVMPTPGFRSEPPEFPALGFANPQNFLSGAVFCTIAFLFLSSAFVTGQIDDLRYEPAFDATPDAVADMLDTMLPPSLGGSNDGDFGTVGDGLGVGPII